MGRTHFLFRCTCAPQIFRTPLRSLLFQAIFMMQSAENSRRFDDAPRGELVPVGAGRSLCLGGLRNSRPECRMRAAPIVVNDELRDNPLQVPIAKRNQVVQALAANRAHEPFDVAVRRRCSDRGLEHAHAEGSQLLIHGRGENAVPVMDQESILVIEREKFAELLDGPFRCRVIGDVGVEDPSGADFHRHKDVQHAEVGGDRGHEIAGHDGLRVVAHEDGPALIAGTAVRLAAEVLSHCSRRHSDAELEAEFVGDPFLPPGRIVAVHGENQRAKIIRQRRAAAPTRPPSPEISESRTVPTDERFRLDDHQGVMPVKEPGERQHGESNPRCGSARPNVSLLEESELFAEEEVLSDERGA